MTFYITDQEGNELLEFYPSSDLTQAIELFDPEIHSLWLEDGEADYAGEFETLCTIIEMEKVEEVFAALEVYPTAYNLGTALDAYTNHYAGYFEDEGELAQNIMGGNYPEIPGFLVVDWQATGEYLKQDYLEHNGHYFRR